MGKTAHTPGPWHWVKCRTMQHLHGINGYFGISLSMPNRGSNMTWNTPEYRERLEANARLIAAVPELLESGEELHHAMVNLLKAYADVQRHYGLKPEYSPIYIAAREANRKHVAAIAKARGE